MENYENMKIYKTLKKLQALEITIEKSKFIGYAKPIKTQEEAIEFIEEIKKKHKDATHNVPAFVLGESFQIQWASDDGEPQGTAGAPIVQMLVKEGITNLAVVVTRYFGGVKLGTGGLVRAYTSTAKETLLKAGIVEYRPEKICVIKYPYDVQGKMEGIIRKTGVIVEKTNYLEEITSEILLNQQEEKFKELIEGITSVRVIKKNTVYRGYDV